MLIENILYFALGVLVAGLLALIILPAVWKRAVRLTKRRIEAATPITMAEFRADKDQLRAEFALSTRRLEMNVETLRRRLAEQLGELNQKRSEVGQLKAERDQYLAAVGELEVRLGELRERVTELERENTDLAQRLRMRERDLAGRNEELEKLRDTLRDGPPRDAAEAPDLIAAEARIASAENRLNTLLAETSQVVEQPDGRAEQLLADKLSLEEQVESLRRKVSGVESTLLADWDSERIDEISLREKLNDIAASVSRLVYAADTESPADNPLEESLFDRVQRFADEEESADMVPPPSKGARKGGSVTDRMAALREIQGQ